MSSDITKQSENFFQNLSESLDIPESRYKQAEDRYRSIGIWLGRDESVVARNNPIIYPQGSFRLGTVIKPISEEEDYDIDLVCELDFSKKDLSQQKLKDLVGHEIVGYAKANNMDNPPEEGRRCWTINYADGAQFHMDILPAIPDGDSFGARLEANHKSADWSEDAIAITDITSVNYQIIDEDWLGSNPKGYCKWFQDQMRIRLDERKAFLAESLKANVEDIPEYRVKTPLQQAIQILKRHRDIMFADDQDDKPISIIITTLAAHAYNNEANLLEALMNIINNMDEYIADNNGVKWISNPVNPLENFADKWEEFLDRERNFYKWLNKVRADLNSIFMSKNLQSINEGLKQIFGERASSEAISKLPEKIVATAAPGNSLVRKFASIFGVAHRQHPTWPRTLIYKVNVSCQYRYNGKRQTYRNDGPRLPQGCDMFFTAETDAPHHYDVYWQVVNTGNEAKEAGKLRGRIFPGNDGLHYRDSTAYNGSHWLECYIVKNGHLVARSGEFVVNRASCKNNRVVFCHYNMLK